MSDCDRGKMVQGSDEDGAVLCLLGDMVIDLAALAISGERLFVWFLVYVVGDTHVLPL